MEIAAAVHQDENADGQHQGAEQRFQRAQPEHDVQVDGGHPLEALHGDRVLRAGFTERMAHQMGTGPCGTRREGEGQQREPAAAQSANRPRCQRRGGDEEAQEDGHSTNNAEKVYVSATEITLGERRG